MTFNENDYFCFVSDADGVWYRVPVKLREDFYDWTESKSNYVAEEDLEAEPYFPDFSKYRSLHPCNYMFKTIEVLKETE